MSLKYNTVNIHFLRLGNHNTIQKKPYAFFVGSNDQKQLKIGSIVFIQSFNQKKIPFLKPAVITKNFTERLSQDHHKRVSKTTSYNLNTYLAMLAQQSSNRLQKVIDRENK
ncbi:hypothetical protein WR164_13850 [Philodulcilactobacillus myokoensis]|uniref:Uncharacterized protein n=1 Tax=Philodulcilactobacillus myokoensis TaxID=2929573 RepID=A0A9W6ESU2_9LACO|nr:hypothetical protein [Philodulcilactobacillus myokoensis]GLB47406.1 hypothetical protein WR164_13850 [Philodulcilactobacillus myokoensis]